MKKLSFLTITIAVVATLFSCKKDEPKEGTFFVNVYRWGGNLSFGSTVQLYDFENFDFEKSIYSIYDDSEMTLQNGSTKKPKYQSQSITGINVFNKIPYGNYYIIAFRLSDSPTDPKELNIASSSYGYRKITVNKDTDMILYNILFSTSDSLTYVNDFGKFVEK